MSPLDLKRSYWRSLDELAGTPDYKAFMENEFPEGASEAPSGIPRRQMLMLLGASLSLAGAAACRRPVEHIVPFVDPPEQSLPGVPRYYATSMPLGTRNYGLVVESHEGRPTKVEGNDAHPASGGATSVWMQAAILDLYDPDRSHAPVHFVSDGDGDAADAADDGHGGAASSAGAPATWDAFAAAWKTLYDGYAAGGGQGLAVLGGSFASPTLARLKAEFAARFPNASWTAWDPVSDEQVRDGLRRATGRDVVPNLDLAAAKVVLALDADLFGSDPDAVAHTRGFSAGRRVATKDDAMNRLYVVEGNYTITGGMADHRLRLAGSQIGGFVADLAAALGGAGTADAWVAAVAKDLRANAGASVVAAGPSQPAGVHAAVAAINDMLGNTGRTVRYHAPASAVPSNTGDLRALAHAMHQGEVETLVILGGNPVYDAPADLKFADALAGVKNKIHFGMRLDETGRACDWHLPRAHFLESWGDGEAADGTLSVTQPLVAPLYDSRSDADFAALLLAGEAADNAGYDAVRATWQLGETAWNRVLHAGVHAGGTTEVAVTVDPGAAAAASAGPVPSQQALELSFVPDLSVYDGRWANNGWLQELPDAVTKLTWSNAALLSPATAAALGVGKEDVVTLTAGEHAIEAPVWLAPGQADWTVGLALGYGREAAGRVGNGIGANAYALRTSGAPWRSAVTLAAAGGRVQLASTQDHGSMVEPHTGSVRPVVREATLEEFRAEPRFAAEMVQHPDVDKQPFEGHDYGEGYQWGMTIDLNVCTGCNACVVACQSENNIPVVGPEQTRLGREMQWLRIDRYFVSDEGDPEVAADPEMVQQPVPCMHCENAPCEQVCPVAATVHDEEGLNSMAYNRCIGTRYCSNNCPYKVRRFNYFNFTKDLPEIMQLAQNPDVTVRSRGVIEKCSYCTQRINAAKIHAKLDGRTVHDGEIQTACQQACPAGAIVFGNINDPDSEVAKAKAQDRNYGMLTELNVRPRTTYGAKLRNPNPELAS